MDRRKAGTFTVVGTEGWQDKGGTDKRGTDGSLLACYECYCKDNVPSVPPIHTPSIHLTVPVSGQVCITLPSRIEDNGLFTVNARSGQGRWRRSPRTKHARITVDAAMSEHSNIEWTEATWNPVRGCTKISPGCKHCYAETFASDSVACQGTPTATALIRVYPEYSNRSLGVAADRLCELA